MVDESNSAHQFSLKDASVQAAEKLELAMQTSEIVMKSQHDQTSMQGAKHIDI